MRRLVCLAPLLLAGCSSVAADPVAKPETVTHYDPDTDHLWNRLHAALFVRTDRDGNTAGRDAVDPLVFPTTKRLLEGPSHAAAVKLLDEFLAGGHALVADPVKRAVMQRDLWAVFDWATYPFGNAYTAGDPIKLRTGPLQERLAKAVRKLAPTKAEAEKLPDTYVLAVKSKAFPAAFDPAKPNAAYLPPDLFDADGPWVCVTGPKAMSTPVAVGHVRRSAGRSVFLVFLKLPGGRQATLDYLKTLNAFAKPWLVPPEGPDEITGLSGQRGELNPDVPQFPAGTQVALVRRLVVVADDGTLVATRLVESVQLRTYQTIRPKEKDYSGGDTGQGVVELGFRRADLFAGKAGGLHAADMDALVRPAATFFGHWSDPFEAEGEVSHNQPRRLSAMCADCHTRGGIRSVNSYTQFGTSTATRELGLFPTTAADEQARTAAWKAGLKDWAELKKHAGW